MPLSCPVLHGRHACITPVSPDMTVLRVYGDLPCKWHLRQLFRCACGQTVFAILTVEFDDIRGVLVLNTLFPWCFGIAWHGLQLHLSPQIGTILRMQIKIRWLFSFLLKFVTHNLLLLVQLNLLSLTLFHPLSSNLALGSFLNLLLFLLIIVRSRLFS